MDKIYLSVGTPRAGERFADFSVIYATGGGKYVKYAFGYLVREANAENSFSHDVGGSVNCELFRVEGAWLGTLSGESFTEELRLLATGEISFALRELGASDFVGGIHGDEHLTAVELFADGECISLDKPGFYVCRELTLSQVSVINRCNTPSEKIILHKQKYCFEKSELRLSQHIEWIAEPLRIDRAFVPMLTIARLDSRHTDRVITDTVELYGASGELIAAADTSVYGTEKSAELPRSLLLGTPASRAFAYGRESGISAEVAIVSCGGDFELGDTVAHIWPRFLPNLDNKIYFNVYNAEKQVHTGTVWGMDVVYRLNYRKE